MTTRQTTMQHYMQQRQQQQQQQQPRPQEMTSTSQMFMPASAWNMQPRQQPQQQQFPPPPQAKQGGGQFVRLALLYPYENPQPAQYDGSQTANADPKTLYNVTSCVFAGRFGEGFSAFVYQEQTPRKANAKNNYPQVHVVIWPNEELDWVTHHVDPQTMQVATDGQQQQKQTFKTAVAPVLYPITPVWCRMYLSNNSAALATGSLTCMPGTRVGIFPSVHKPNQVQLTVMQD